MKYIKTFNIHDEHVNEKEELEDLGFYLSYCKDNDESTLYYEQKQFPMPFDNEYVDQYLTIEALEENTAIKIVLGNNFAERSMTEFYTSTNGTTWYKEQLPYFNGPELSQIVLLPNIGSKLYLKGKVRNYDVTFNGIGNSVEFHWEIELKPESNVKVYGNIMSMVYGDKFQNKTRMPNSTTMIFHNMFADSHFTDVENLMLPCVEMQPYLYTDMFTGAGITKSPILPAETLATGCYNRMFYGCSNLNRVISNVMFNQLGINNTNGWLYNVANSGVFQTNQDDITLSEFGANYIPNDWQILQP